MFKREDWLVGISSVLLGAFVLIVAGTFQERTSMDPAGPGGVPTILAWVIIIIGIIHLAGAFLTPKLQEDKKDKWAKEFEEAKPVLRIAAVCIAYIILLEIVGYLIATPLLIIGIMYVINVRNIRNLLLTSLVTTGILFVIFGVVPKVQLPMGFFEAFL